MKHAAVIGTGSCLPARVLSNHDLEKIVDTSNEWITSRTGIATRRIAAPDQTTHQLATEAAKKALSMAGVEASDLDLIVVASVSPEMIMPSCACFVQDSLGAVNAFAYDINAACSGFLFGMDLVDKYIAARPEMKILLIGAERLSARVNWRDRNTCILFGDGAGACVLAAGNGTSGIVDSNLFSDGSLWSLLYMNGPRNLNPELQLEQPDDCYIRMMGRDVFKYAVRAMEEAVVGLLRRHEKTVDDVKLVIPHQANIRILHKLMERLNLSEDKVFVNVSKYGNTSAASIPIALDEANRANLLTPGDLLLFCSFGGGFTWGSMLMHW
ncbi:MAG: ketoacyl-ACP synthase III [Desulfobulbaceae bacterium]|nr:ketoacyl-ACP synthase III [Desulfobulbaceae bacterium]